VKSNKTIEKQFEGKERASSVSGSESARIFKVPQSNLQPKETLVSELDKPRVEAPL
jgi:hypothetical protein